MTYLYTGHSQFTFSFLLQRAAVSVLKESAAMTPAALTSSSLNQDRRFLSAAGTADIPD
jgi:hypothetical protein